VQFLSIGSVLGWLNRRWSAEAVYHQAHNHKYACERQQSSNHWGNSRPAAHRQVSYAYPMMLRGLRSVVWVGALICMSSLWACGTTISDKDLDEKQVSVAEVRRLQDLQKRKNRDDVILLIDPRPPADFAKGHIPGARNLQLSTIQPNDPLDPTIDRFKNIVVYGKDPSSAAARAMAKTLMAKGYSNVVWFATGIHSWLTTGGQLEGTDTPQAQASGTP